MNQKKWILLVRDEHSSPSNEKELLENLGYEVTLAYSRFEALETLKSNQTIDLVLLDMSPQLASEILPIRNLPIVYLSNDPESVPMTQEERSMASGFVIKNSGLSALDISIRVALRLFQQEEGNRYQSALENTSEAVWAADASGKFRFMSTVMAKIYGQSLEAMLADNDFWIKAVYPEDKERVLAGHVELFRNHFVELEYRIVLPDGTVKWISDRKFVKLNKINGCQEISGIVSDITDRKKANEALRISEQKLRTMLNTMSEGLALNECIFDEKGEMIDYRIVEVNEAFYSTADFVPGPVIGNLATLLYQMPKEVIKNFWFSHKDATVVAHTEYFSQNSSRWFYISTSPITDGKFVTSFIDLTKRKLAEVAIANEKERLAVTLRSIADGVITTDTQERVLLMSKVAEELTGWKQLHAIGLPLSQIFHTREEGTRQPNRNRILISKEGRERTISDSTAPIKDYNGMTIGEILVFRDVTEIQKNQEALQRAEKLDSLGILAGGIAHDFNNMLAGMFGYLELARELSTDQKVRTFLDKSASVYERAKNLTQQLLTFAKGGSPLKRTIDMGKLVQDAVTFALSGSSASCDFEMEQDLWPAHLDTNQIEQVIDNLVINATQSMTQGGKIHVRAQNFIIGENTPLLLKPGKFIKLSITDEGGGIPPEVMNQIFDPFFTTKPHGHGLGLATCYAIIQKHDGCIDVESVVGKGTTFHVYLPAMPQGARETLAASPVIHSGVGHILVMDDEMSVREILSAFLRDMGYTVLEATGGEEAIRICTEMAEKGTPVGQAFLDLTVPGGMGGKEALSHIRKLFPTMRIYASSGYSADPVMARPQEYGFTASISKPFLKDTLAALLNKYQ